MFHTTARRPTIGLTIIAIAALGLLMMGCSPASAAHAMAEPDKRSSRVEVTSLGVRVLENVQFGEASGEPLLLDLCLPEHSATAPRPAVILVHGGSWTHGDKSQWLGICQWLASDGFVAASIGYRLAPAHVFPAGLDDLRTAVRWLKDPAQVAKYAIEPSRIGAFGGSAGGNLVSLLGVTGTGSTDSGDRVAAVVELSAPIDLTRNGPEQKSFYPYELSYLGCTSYADCPQAVAASPIFHVASGDPPFFVAQSTHERIPLVQSERFVDALRAGGVPTTFETRPGDRHSIAILDAALRERILDFLRSHLGDPTSASAEATP
jgi:acetyl esterase/lipase